MKGQSQLAGAPMSDYPMTPAGRAQLKTDEGTRLVVYDDKSGRPILKGPAGGNPSIGIGRNLAARGITEDEADYLLDNDLKADWADLVDREPVIANFPPVWRDVVAMVQFNTGDALAFHEMLDAMNAGSAANAAAALMDSRAARELPARYGRMRDAILAGAWG